MNTPDIAFQKGRTYKEMGLLNEAIAEFESTLSDESWKYRASREIASCYVVMGHPDRAEKALLHSLLSSDVPMNERLRISYDLAMVQSRLGKTESALERLIQIQTTDSQLFPEIDQKIAELHSLLDPDQHGIGPDIGLSVTQDQEVFNGCKPDDSSIEPEDHDPRRGSPRITLSTPVEYSFDQMTWSTGYCTDLSKTGIFVLTYEPIPVGSVVFIRFDLPKSMNSLRMEIIGQAVRQGTSQIQQDSAPQEVLGMGIHFVSIDRERRLALNRFLDTLYAEARKLARQAELVRFSCMKCSRILSFPQADSGLTTDCECGEKVHIPYAYPNPTKENPLRGYVIAGCRIDAVVGAGSVATVYLAHHLALDIPVAVKVLNPDLKRTTSRMAAGFLTEARVIVRMNHPNIVGVMNAGEHDGLSFIIMQYVAGRSLGDILRKGEKITLNDFLRIFIDVCKALSAARELSVVHRDVKPDNILLTHGGKAMLADFGLVKDLKTYEDNEQGLALGTPLYISPEQAKGQIQVDHRSDIYSLGATMYHVLAGRPPFPGVTPFEVMRKHVKEPLTPLTKVVPGTPETLATIVGNCLQKEPDLRYQSSDELKQALLNWSSEIAAARFKPLSKKLRRNGND